MSSKCQVQMNMSFAVLCYTSVMRRARGAHTWGAGLVGQQVHSSINARTIDARRHCQSLFDSLVLEMSPRKRWTCMDGLAVPNVAQLMQGRAWFETVLLLARPGSPCCVGDVAGRCCTARRCSHISDAVLKWHRAALPFLRGILQQRIAPGRSSGLCVVPMVRHQLQCMFTV